MEWQPSTCSDARAVDGTLTTGQARFHRTHQSTVP